MYPQTDHSRKYALHTFRKPTRIAMTGANSLLGRNLLFEILKTNVNNLDHLEIILLGRGKNGKTFRERIVEIVGEMHTMVNADELRQIQDYCQQQIVYIEIELSDSHMKLDPQSLQALQRAPIDFFFHLVATSNFRDLPAVRELLRRVNVEGTRNTLDLVRHLQIGEYCYVSTAYVCGTTTGRISPEYINLDQPFNNPYEESKLRAEILVREFCTEANIRWRVFRTASICGRLIEPPLGSISKFDIFYGWAAYWLQVKAQLLGGWSEIYARPLQIDVRICFNTLGGLNIVPADFTAKAIYQVCIQNAPGQSYHIVNKNETPHAMHIPAMFETINVQGFRQCDSIPLDLNELERAYYRTLGVTFTPYMTAAPIDFDTTSIQPVLDKAGLQCPPVDKANFQLLMDFAKQHDFGVDHI